MSIFKRKTKPKVKVGDYIDHPVAGRYGKVIKVGVDGTGERHANWALYHKYDTKTGLPMVCPDDRCPNHTQFTGVPGSCPICQHWAPEDEYNVLPEADIAFFRETGLITDKLN